MGFSKGTTQYHTCIACAYLFPATFTTAEANSSHSTSFTANSFEGIRDTASECYITSKDRALLGCASQTWMWVSLASELTRTQLLTTRRSGRLLVRLTTLEGVQPCLPLIESEKKQNSSPACIFVPSQVAAYLGMSLGRTCLVKLKAYSPRVLCSLLPDPFCQLPVTRCCVLRALFPLYSTNAAPSFEQWREILLDYFSVPRLLAQGQVVAFLTGKARFSCGVPTALQQGALSLTSLPRFTDAYSAPNLSLCEVERGITQVIDYPCHCLSRTASQCYTCAERSFSPAFSWNSTTTAYQSTLLPCQTSTDKDYRQSSRSATLSSTQRLSADDVHINLQLQHCAPTYAAPTGDEVQGKRATVGNALQYKYSVNRRQDTWSPRSNGNPVFVPPLTTATWQRRAGSLLLYLYVDRLELFPQYTRGECLEAVGVVYKGVTNVFLEQGATEKRPIPSAQLYHHLRCAMPKSPELYATPLEEMFTDGWPLWRSLKFRGRRSRRAFLLKGFRGCGRRTLTALACERLGVNFCELDGYTIAEKLEKITLASEELRHVDGSVAPGGNSPLSACLVRAAHSAAPAIIFITHLGKLLRKLRRGRQRQAEMRACCHLKWFLTNHCCSENERCATGRESTLRSADSFKDVFVVGSVSDEESDIEGQGNRKSSVYSDFICLFDSVMDISAVDNRSRHEVVRVTIESLEQQACNMTDTIAVEISQMRPKSVGEELRAVLWQAFHKHAEAQENHRDPRLSAENRFSLSDVRRIPRVSDSDANFPSSAVHWEDVGGIEEAKSEIKDHVVLPLRHPQLFKGIRTGGGLLLFGPPGTGKTMLAKTVATDSRANFISVKGPEILNMYIGESELNVRTIFKRARESAPCVLFFDELDALLPRRGRLSDSGGVIDRVVAQLLGEIDDLPHNVLLIGATNRVELLDKSALRPGRLDRCIYVGMQADRIPLLKALTRGMSLEEKSQSSRDSKLRDTYILDALNSTIPPEFTAADCKALCGTAGMIVLKKKVRFLRRISSGLGIPPRVFLEVVKCGEQSLEFKGIRRTTRGTDPHDMNSTNSNGAGAHAWLSDFPQCPLRLRLLYDTTNDKTQSSHASSYDVQLWSADFSDEHFDISPEIRLQPDRLWIFSTLPKGWRHACRKLAYTAKEQWTVPSLLLEFQVPTKGISEHRSEQCSEIYEMLPQATLAGRRSFLWIQTPVVVSPKKTSSIHHIETCQYDMSVCKGQQKETVGPTALMEICSTRKSIERIEEASEGEALVQYIVRNVDQMEWGAHELLQSTVTLHDFLDALRLTRQSLTKEEYQRYEKLRLTYSKR